MTCAHLIRLAFALELLYADARRPAATYEYTRRRFTFRPAAAPASPLPTRVQTRITIWTDA
jgi:hypothetical protein